MSEEVPTIGTEHSAEEDTTETTGSARSSRSYDEFPEEVVDYVLTMLEQNGMDVEIAVTNEDARELSEEEVEYFGLDAEYQSVEDLFGLTTEADFIGSPPRDAVEGCEDCDGPFSCNQHDEYKSTCGNCDGGTLCETHDMDTDRNFPIEIVKRLNGNHLNTIWERFGEGHIRGGMGKASRHDRDPMERRQWLRLWYSDTEKQARSAKKDEYNAGQISEEEYVEWCVENEVHPQPRKQGTPELSWYAENGSLK